MPHKTLLIVFTIALLPLLAAAQKVRLIQSTSTSWSGGVAGKHGTRYEFVIEFSGYGTQVPEPDTLWLGNKCVPLIGQAATYASYNMVRTVGKRKVTFRVWGGTSNEDEDSPVVPYPDAPIEKKDPKPAPPVKYAGVALLSYKYKDKQSYFAVEKIMTFGTPVNYP